MPLWGCVAWRVFLRYPGVDWIWSTAQGLCSSLAIRVVSAGYRYRGFDHLAAPVVCLPGGVVLIAAGRSSLSLWGCLAFRWLVQCMFPRLYQWGGLSAPGSSVYRNAVASLRCSWLADYALSLCCWLAEELLASLGLPWFSHCGLGPPPLLHFDFSWEEGRRSCVGLTFNSVN